ncbi:MAG: hypothetical protein LBP76_05805 [Treponema sp.]|jgi:hypothetical protein|nr:hypothetical protein [Treponema sp.]
MKKLLAVIMLLSCAVSLWSQEIAEPKKQPKKRNPDRPLRYVEFGLDMDAGLANNVFGFGDIFNAERTLTVDFKKLASSINDINADIAGKIDVFFNVNFGEEFGIGFHGGVDVLIYGDISEEILEFLADGNKGNIEGALAAGGSIFWDNGINMYTKFEKLKVRLSPSLFVPLVYMPKPTAKISIHTENPLSVNLELDARIYTPLSIVAENLMELSGNDTTASRQVNSNELSDAYGFDMSVDAEYELFPFLDVGGSISHIPLYPARLSHSIKTTYSYSSGDFNDILDDLIKNDFELPDSGEVKMERKDNESFKVYRPLRFNIFADYKPQSIQSNLLGLTVRPNLGLSFLTVYDTVCFNAGLEAQLRFMRLLYLKLGMAYHERIWRNYLNFALNLRVIELDLGVGIQSQNFLKSFQLNGLNAVAGFRMGF